MTTILSGSASAKRRYSRRTRSWKSADSRSIRSGASVRRPAPTSGGKSSRKVVRGLSPSVAHADIAAISSTPRLRAAPW